jgi:S-adenosylmethionine:tRNA ribosyltransferase-isomerase
VRLSDFDFELPRDLIAQRPLAQRAASRLLDCRGCALADRYVHELPALLSRGDLLVMNDTRVLKARLLGTKATGGRIELLIERLLDGTSAQAQWRASHAPAIASLITLSDGSTARVASQDGAFLTLVFERAVSDVLQVAGTLPLPPYIEHAPDAMDEERYQTVYARVAGAVAAPTAGLHFDAALLAELAQSGIEIATLTLHVGAGTFLPVRSEVLEEHVMHAERYHIPTGLDARIRATRERGARVIAVGTTTLRALEAATSATGGVLEGDAQTDIFITPGFRFRTVDALITNFHLPRSTLLMLVSAFAGYDLIRRAYARAIEQRYRFFSYGDAMLLERA